MPASVADILEFFEIASGDAFDVAPEKAVAFFAAKGLQPTFSYGDMIGQAHDSAFTIAKMMDVDLLGQVRASLDSAMANGTSFAEWKKEVLPGLQKAGWWGVKKKVDPDTGRVVAAQLGSPWRLETIFRTNMQSAYAAGAWQEIQAQADEAPFLMYDAVDDFRTRPLHASWDRKVLPVDNAFWKTHYPPNGYNCRCGVIQLDAAQLQQLGLKVAKDAPDDGTYLWKNPRTGYALEVPRGIDPGFDHNPGVSMQQQTEKLLEEKLAAQGKQQAAAARAALAKKQAYDAAVAQAQAELAAAAAQAALKRAQALAAEKALQWQAQQQLDVIAKGAGPDPGKFLSTAFKKAKAAPDWPDLQATEKLAAVQTLAADLKAKHTLSTKLSQYKKAILEGKNPSPSATAAFKSLPADEASAFIAKVDAEKAAIEAQKAAEAAKAAEEAAKAAKATQAASASTSKAASLLQDSPPDPATMTVIGRKTKGGTEGAFYQDTATGQKYLVKFPGSEDAVRNEVLASKLYNLAGAQAPELHSIVIEGKPALASRLIDGIKEVDAKTLAATDSVQDAFAIDAWLANWDTVGMSYDNIVLVGGRAVRIDVGGSLRYRALGGLKGAAFGDKVTELDSLRDASLNRQSADVFGRITQQQIEDGVVRVLRTSDDDIALLVSRYGPTDPAEAKALTARLIARKADLAKRFPAAAARAKALDNVADSTPAAPPRVTDTEQRFIEDSRANGFGFKTDSDQVEDQMVVVNTLTDADGKPATRGWLKARPEAAKRILDTIKSAAGSEVTVNPLEAADAILAAIKGINTRASKGWEQKDLDRIDQAVAAFARLQADAAKAMPNLRSGPRALLEMTVEDMEIWIDRLKAKRAEIKVGGTGAGFAENFQHGRLSTSSVSYTIGGQAGAVKWTRKTSFNYQVSTIDRGRVTLTKQTNTLPQTGEVYEGTLADGTRVTFVTDTSANGYATRGIMQIDVSGTGVPSTEAVFRAMDELGLKSERSTQADRDALYLAAFARMKFARQPAVLKQFETLAGIDEKLKFIKAKTGVDVEASDGWRKREGQYEAFGHGRARLIRPDLDTPEFEAFAATSRVYHDPNYCKAKMPIWDRLLPIVDAGGQFASLTDRVRRGVIVRDDGSAASAGRDLQTGGGSYYFTRIVDSGKKSPGFYWKPRVLKRMDAVTYDSDLFGDVSDGTQQSERMGQSVADFERMKARGSNETIFKDSLSLFDDLEFVVFESKAARDAAIKEMKARGYATWPDGRKIEDVFRS